MIKVQIQKKKMTKIMIRKKKKNENLFGIAIIVIVYTILGYNFIAYINLFKFVNIFSHFINLVR